MFLEVIFPTMWGQDLAAALSLEVPSSRQSRMSVSDFMRKIHGEARLKAMVEPDRFWGTEFSDKMVNYGMLGYTFF